MCTPTESRTRVTTLSGWYARRYTIGAEPTASVSTGPATHALGQTQQRGRLADHEERSGEGVSQTRGRLLVFAAGCTTAFMSGRRGVETHSSIRGYVPVWLSARILNPRNTGSKPVIPTFLFCPRRSGLVRRHVAATPPQPGRALVFLQRARAGVSATCGTVL